MLNAAAVGVPDAVRGERVKAFIVLKPGKFSQVCFCYVYRDAHCLLQPTSPSGVDSAECAALKAEIAQFVKSKLASYEYPREIEFMESLPMTTTSKIIRRELRRMHIERENAKQSQNGGKSQ